MARRTSTAIARSSRPAVAVAWLLGGLWVVEGFNALNDHQLATYGILPRTRTGLTGIPLAPFLHGSLAHIASNTLPLGILGFLVAMGGRGRLAVATIVTMVVGGAGVWVFGRDAYHVGASILVFGYFGFLVASALYERSFVSLMVAGVTLALYSGLIWGVLPQGAGISWEGHLFGLAGGVIAARAMRRG